MKKGTLLKSLGRLPAGKTVEVSDATFVRLTDLGYFEKVKTKEEKHGKIETKAAKARKVNAVVDEVIGAVDQG